MLEGIVAVGIVFLLDSKPIATMAGPNFYRIFDNEATMRIFVEVVAISGFHCGKVDSRPVTMEWYDGLSLAAQKEFLKSVLIGLWDNMTLAERHEQVRLMPLECHRCNQRKPHTSVSAEVGYTRLICTDCAFQIFVYTGDE